MRANGVRSLDVQCHQCVPARGDRERRPSSKVVRTRRGVMPKLVAMDGPVILQAMSRPTPASMAASTPADGQAVTARGWRLKTIWLRACHNLCHSRSHGECCNRGIRALTKADHNAVRIELSAVIVAVTGRAAHPHDPGLPGAAHRPVHAGPPDAPNRAAIMGRAPDPSSAGIYRAALHLRGPRSHA